jgi:hypothetical protein
MNGKVVWDAAVIGWRRLAELPSADGVFTWEQHGDADCFWWTGRPGKIAHQLFLSAPSSEAMTRSVRLALDSPTPQAGCDLSLRVLDRPDLAAALDELHPTSTNTAPLMLCDLADRLPSPPSEFTTAIIGTSEEPDYSAWSAACTTTQTVSPASSTAREPPTSSELSTATPWWRQQLSSPPETQPTSGQSPHPKRNAAEAQRQQ